MRKLKVLLFNALMAGFIFNACEKKDNIEPDNEGEISDTNIISDPDPDSDSDDDLYPNDDDDDDSSPADTTIPPENSKPELEQAAVDFVAELDQLSHSEGIDIMVHLAYLWVTDFPFTEEAVPTIISKSLSTMSGNDAEKMKKHLSHSFKTLSQSEPAIMNEFLEVAGTYTWNHTTSEWDYTGSPADAIIFKFPADQQSTENNTSITFDNVSTTTVTDPMWTDLEDEITETLEIPTSLDVSLEYNSHEVSSLSYSAIMLNSGLPSDIDITYVLGDFTFSTIFNHINNNAADLTYTVTNSTETIIEFHGSVSGDWSMSNIDDNVEIIEYEDEYSYYQSIEIHLEEIFQNANSHFQIMNFKLTGEVDVKKLGDEIWEIMDDDLSEQEEIDQLVTTMNNYSTLALVYADGSGTIATAEFIAKEYEDEYCYYDWESGVTLCDNDTYWDPAVNLIFPDDSEVEASVYFSDMFDAALSDFEDLLYELENKYMEMY
ncbi:MAG: hypothetical protein GVY19_11415 [Bacteroidetes bacterium]|jgi:hypothetical protein|nr:hypothetical protein [Bacteroidota bacterium]